MLPKLMLKTLCIITLMPVLSGCFETGENKGSNLIAVNGSLLKGSTRNADLKIFDAQGRVIWQGKSDAQGNYSASLSSGQSQLYTIIARITEQSSMICDAVECVAPLSNKTYLFGESMPGSELGDLEIKSTVYLNAPTNSSEVRQSVQQVNSMTSLMVDVMKDDLSASMSQQSYRAVLQASNEVVLSALGMTQIDDSINMMNEVLPDLTKGNTSANISDDTTTLGVVNGSQSSSLTRMNQFSAALVTIKNDPTNPNAQAILSSAQEQVMQQASALIQTQNISNSAVAAMINHSRQNGIDFSLLEQSVNALNAAAAQANSNVNPIAYRASSHQYGGKAQKASAEMSNHWWWVSASNPTTAKPQSVILEYPQSFVPMKIEIGMSQRFAGHNNVLQGSNDGQDWLDLVSLDPQLANSEHIDERNVRHLSFTLDPSEINGASYRFYQFNSQATKQIWLEYLCLSADLTPPPPAPEQTQHCQHNETPTTTQVSSIALSAGNMQSPSKSSWWISQLASGEEEWAAVEYEQAFIAKTASITIKAQNMGTSALIQGSNDGTQWTDIVSVPTAASLDAPIDARGFIQFDLALNNNQRYLHYRYKSQPTSFVWLAFLNFSG